MEVDLLVKETKLFKASQHLQKVWFNEGLHSDNHAQQIARLKAEWPSLYEAVIQIMVETTVLETS